MIREIVVQSEGFQVELCLNFDQAGLTVEKKTTPRTN